MLLIVYVDDMKLSGPEDEMEKSWADLSKNIHLENANATTISVQAEG